MTVPEMSAAPAVEIAGGPPPDLPRTIGFWGGAAIMVGVTIGSGIFRTPAEIANATDSPAFILLLWLVGGLLSLFGALTYAELATMFPQSGGVYVFLRQGYGRALAFVFGWTYMLITKPLAAAGIGIIFAEHLNPMLGIATDHPSAASLTTCIMLITLTALNARGMNLGASLAKALTSMKVLSLLLIIIIALALMKGSASNFQTGPRSAEFGPWWLALAPIMAGVLWTYDGWSDIGSIAGEVRNPQKLIPRIYIMGTLLLMALYLGVNAVYIWLMPLHEMRGVKDVAPQVAQRLVGEAGLQAVTWAILISTLGATHGAIITGARVAFAQSRDGLLFRQLSRIHPRRQTPHIALWVQCTVSCLAAFAYGFQQLASGFVFTMWIFYGLAAAVIFIERVRRPVSKHPRAYQCWGYPVVPALFVLSALAMTALSIRFDPINTSIWLAGLSLGWPVYWWWSKWFAADRHVRIDDGFPIGQKAKIQLHDPDARFIPPGGWPLVSGTLISRAGAWDRMVSYVLLLDDPFPRGFDPWRSLPKAFAKRQIRRVMLTPWGSRAPNGGLRDMVMESFEMEQRIQVLLCAMLDSDAIPKSITPKIERAYQKRTFAFGLLEPIVSSQHDPPS